MRRELLAVVVVGVLALAVGLVVQSKRTSAQTPEASARYQATLTLVREDETVLHVIDTTTGQVWVVEDSGTWVDQGSPDAEPGSPGRYELRTLSHPIRGGSVWVHVLDTQTGGVWYHNSKGWWPLGRPPA